MTQLTLLLMVVALARAADPPPALRKALTFHVSFDRGVDADFAKGDRRIYTAANYKARMEAKPGLDHPDIVIASGQGRYGDALQFRKKNTKAVFYQGKDNVAYQSRNWNGTVSFWLSLDPDRDLEPGFSDPIQVTAEAYNDAALWVDFSRDERPRHFRLGVFGDLKVWNPQNLPSDKNPDFSRRLITVTKPPFGRGQWTHIVITHSALNTEKGGVAKLYLNGKLQGAAEPIREPFTWDVARASIRLGLSYVGLFDELSVFSRELNDKEVEALYRADRGAGALHP